MLTRRAAGAAHLRLADPLTARLAVLRAVQATPAVPRQLREATGAVLARDVRAVQPLPSSDTAAVDGYAIAAEHVSGGRTDRFEAIGAGQALPEWADAVVPLQYAVREDGQIRLEFPVAPAMHVRPAGEELPGGALALRAGTTLAPTAIGLLAALETRQVLVHREPRIALLLSAKAMGPMLRSLVEVAGAKVTAVAHVSDDPAVLEGVLRDLAASADLVVASGGASGGSRNHVVASVQRVGELQVHELAVRPGRAASFGTIAGTAVALLSGSPLAALVGFEILARPAIRRLAGASDPFRTAIELPVAGVAALSDRWLAVPVRLTGRGEGTAARPVAPMGAAMLAAAATADGLALVPPAPGPATDRLSTRMGTIELW